MVVIVTPDGQLPAGIGQAVEQFLVEDSSRREPLKLSMNPFCWGLPGSM
jgi:hypothetical protein